MTAYNPNTWKAETKGSKAISTQRASSRTAQNSTRQQDYLGQFKTVSQKTRINSMKVIENNKTFKYETTSVVDVSLLFPVLFCFWLFKAGVSNPSWSNIHCIVQVDLELIVIPLPLTAECQDYQLPCLPLSQFFESCCPIKNKRNYLCFYLSLY